MTPAIAITIHGPAAIANSPVKRRMRAAPALCERARSQAPAPTTSTWNAAA